MEEIWKDIVGYEGLYKVSNLGNVLSISYNKTNNSKLIKGSYSNNYHRVGIRLKGKRKWFFTHVLVAKHFCDKYSYQYQVNHIDGNTLNNNFNNLEWVSQIENHSHKSYRLKSSSKYVGVSKHINKNKWVSYISLNKKRIYIGIYGSELEAFAARVKYEKDNNIINKYLC